MRLTSNPLLYERGAGARVSLERPLTACPVRGDAASSGGGT